MSLLRSRLGAVFGFSSLDDALSSEHARNADARANLAALRHVTLEEKKSSDQKIASQDEKIKKAQEAYHDKLTPFIEDFDNLVSAEHAYFNLSTFLSSAAAYSEALLQREPFHYGFGAKKLISKSLHFESLKTRIQRGLPFSKELEVALTDFESEDMKTVAAPLHHSAPHGIPSDAAARAEAFILSQTIEEMGEADGHRPLKRWLDFLKFQSSISPSTLAKNKVQARTQAKEFMRLVRENNYMKALEVVGEAEKMMDKNNEFVRREFKKNAKAFRDAAQSILVAQMFLSYGSANVICERFANVEKTVQQ